MKKVLNLLLRSGAAAKYCRGTYTRSYLACRRLIPIVNSNVFETHDLCQNSPLVFQHRLLSESLNAKGETEERYIFKLTRLPFQNQEDHIQSLLRKVNITPKAIYPLYLYHNLDLLSGSAYIEVSSAEEVQRAKELQGHVLNERPILVFFNLQEDWKKIIAQQTWVDPYLRILSPIGKSLRDDEIKSLFKDFEFGSRGILRYKSTKRENSKTFYLHFSDMEEAEKAFKYVKSLQDIRAFKINWSELQYRLRATDHRVELKGLPYMCTYQDIVEFLAPVKPVGIFFNYSQVQPTSCGVYFENNEDLTGALEKNLTNMGNRYIEVYSR